MTDLARLQIYRQWQAEAAAYTGPDRAGQRRGLDDYIHAEALVLARMIAAGETTAEQLIQEARDA